MRLQVRLTVVEWEDLPVIRSFVQFAFRMPVSVRRSAAEMIIAMLQSNPQKRPSVNKLYLFEFIKGHHIPSFLPSSCLTMAPRADEIEGGDIGYNRKPLLEINDNLGITEVILRKLLTVGVSTFLVFCAKLRQKFQKKCKSIQRSG